MSYRFETKEELIEFLQTEIIDGAEARELLNCSKQNIADLIERKKLVPIKKTRKYSLFFKSDIQARSKGAE